MKSKVLSAYGSFGSSLRSTRSNSVSTALRSSSALFMPSPALAVVPSCWSSCLGVGRMHAGGHLAMLLENEHKTAFLTARCQNVQLRPLERHLLIYYAVRARVAWQLLGSFVGGESGRAVTPATLPAEKPLG